MLNLRTRSVALLLPETGDRPNTVSERMVSDTGLSESLGPYRVPGGELSEFLPAYYLPSELTEFFAGLTKLPQNLGEFSLQKQHSRNSIFRPNGYPEKAEILAVADFFCDGPLCLEQCFLPGILSTTTSWTPYSHPSILLLSLKLRGFLALPCFPLSSGSSSVASCRAMPFCETLSSIISRAVPWPPANHCCCSCPDIFLFS